MKKYTEMTKDELMQEKTALEAEYEKIKNLGLSLDMSRRRPPDSHRWRRHQGRGERTAAGDGHPVGSAALGRPDEQGLAQHRADRGHPALGV